MPSLLTAPFTPQGDLTLVCRNWDAIADLDGICCAEDSLEFGATTTP